MDNKTSSLPTKELATNILLSQQRLKRQIKERRKYYEAVNYYREKMAEAIINYITGSLELAVFVQRISNYTTKITEPDIEALKEIRAAYKGLKNISKDWSESKTRAQEKEIIDKMDKMIVKLTRFLVPHKKADYGIGDRR